MKTTIMFVVLMKLLARQPLASALERGQTEGRQSKPGCLDRQSVYDKLGRRGQAMVGSSPARKAPWARHIVIRSSIAGAAADTASIMPLRGPHF
jgi:hypothetical protein